MDVSSILELGVGAAVGIMGMWFMFQLCKSMLENQIKAMAELVAEIKADRVAHSAEMDHLLSRFDRLHERGCAPSDKSDNEQAQPR